MSIRRIQNSSLVELLIFCLDLFDVCEVSFNLFFHLLYFLESNSMSKLRALIIFRLNIFVYNTASHQKALHARLFLCQQWFKFVHLVRVMTAGSFHCKGLFPPLQLVICGSITVFLSNLLSS